MAQEALKVSHADIPPYLRVHLQRKRLRLSIDEVAERAEISRQYLYRIENGRSDPSGKILRRLAGALECSVDYLVGASDIPSKPS